MALNEKITIKNVLNKKTEFNNMLKTYQDSFKKSLNVLFFKIVKIEILKEDIKLFENISDCKKCKFFTICSTTNTHCIQLETLYTDYKICDEFNDSDDMLWKSKEGEIRNYFELEISHLNNLINFLYKNEMATIEDLAKKPTIFGSHVIQLLNQLKIQKNKIRERTKIRVIRKIMKIKEKFEQMELSNLNKEEQLLYSIYSANKGGVGR